MTASLAPSITILKPGTFTDVRGTTVTFTRADLQDVVDSYDRDSDPAPLVVGHPAIGAPAYGWVGRLAIIGDQLRAYPSDIAPAFAEAVKAGRYRKVSPQLYPPRSASNPKPGRWYLQHIGFLGAAAPAIKGLGTVSFSACDSAASVVLEVLADRVQVVGFAAPQGYAVKPDNLAFHARAQELQASLPGLSFWDAFTQARREARLN